jgi:hypothetical protein
MILHTIRTAEHRIWSQPKAPAMAPRMESKCCLPSVDSTHFRTRSARLTPPLPTRSPSGDDSATSRALPFRANVLDVSMSIKCLRMEEKLDLVSVVFQDEDDWNESQTRYGAMVANGFTCRYCPGLGHFCAKLGHCRRSWLAPRAMGKRRWKSVKFNL